MKLCQLIKLIDYNWWHSFDIIFELSGMGEWSLNSASTMTWSSSLPPPSLLLQTANFKPTMCPSPLSWNVGHFIDLMEGYAMGTRKHNVGRFSWCIMTLSSSRLTAHLHQKAAWRWMNPLELQHPEGSMFHLVLRLHGGMQIFVKTLTGKVTSQPTMPHLCWEAACWTLSDYNIQELTLHLVLRLCGGMQIFIKTLTLVFTLLPFPPPHGSNEALSQWRKNPTELWRIELMDKWQSLMTTQPLPCLCPLSFHVLLDISSWGKCIYFFFADPLKMRQIRDRDRWNHV